MTEEGVDAETGGSSRPLRVAALAKQVPLTESFELGPDGRLRRDGTPVEINPYCRRAIAKGTELARASGGTCVTFTFGPPSAEDVLREAVAWGADEGVHLCDPAFAGSDTLATARALAAALRREGPFDLVLVGRNSIDGDTGQVGPELAELLGLPFASGVRRLAVVGNALELGLEQDDGWEDVVVELPALVSVAERLCDPAKVDPEVRRAVPPERIRRLSAADLGDGPWGDAGSPTRVGAVRVLHQDRSGMVLTGDVASQVARAVDVLVERGALSGEFRPLEGTLELAEDGAHSQASTTPEIPLPPSAVAVVDGQHPVVLTLLEPGRPQVGVELLGAGGRLAEALGGEVVALVPPDLSSGPHSSEVSGDGRERGQASGLWGAGGGDPVGAAVAPGVSASGSDQEMAAGLGALGADMVLRVVDAHGAGGGSVPPPGGWAAEDVAGALTTWAQSRAPWVVLAPSTAFGREVAARTAAALGAGLIGDAVAVDVVDGELVAAKPAFAGTLVADITCTSPVQLVTVRPGVLRAEAPRPRSGRLVALPASRRGRVRLRSAKRDDDVEVLARAEVVIGVGAGVAPDEFADLSALAAVLGAELAATRRVTDKGWAPRARQVGLTGRSIAPRLYIAIGLSGKFNHMVGVRAAGTVVAVNSDPAAPVFAHADVGIVGDWHEVVQPLAAALRARGERGATPVGTTSETVT